MCHELVCGASVPWPLMNVTFGDPANDVSMVGELLQHGLHDLAARGASVGKLRRSKVGLSHGPKPQTSAAIGDCEVVTLEDQVRAGAQLVAQRDQVFVSGTHQRQCGVEARLVDVLGRRHGRFQSLIQSAIGLSTMSLPPPENSSTSHGPPAGEPSAQMFREEHAFLDAEHVANLVACFRQIQDRNAEPILEARNDAAAEEGHRIVEPRIPLGEDLQRCERLVLRNRLASLGLGCAFWTRPPRASPLHDLHRGRVFANAVCDLFAPRLLKPPAFGTDGCGRRRWCRILAHGSRRQLWTFRQRQPLASASVTGPVAGAAALGRALAAAAFLAFPRFAEVAIYFSLAEMSSRTSPLVSAYLSLGGA